MATRYFDSKTYEKIGSPDIGSKMFYINQKTKEKVFGFVKELSFTSKKGVKIKIKPYKK